MRRYTLDYNPECQDCVRLAQWNARLDWLNKFERISSPSPMGMPELGDIHVVDYYGGTIFSGAYATQIVCRSIPAYWPIAVMLRIPILISRMANRIPGCNGHRYQ